MWFFLDMSCILLRAEGDFVLVFCFPRARECYWTRCDSGVFSWNSGFAMEFILREREDMNFSTMHSLGILSASLEAY